MDEEYYAPQSEIQTWQNPKDAEKDEVAHEIQEVLEANGFEGAQVVIHTAELYDIITIWKDEIYYVANVWDNESVHEITTDCSELFAKNISQVICDAYENILGHEMPDRDEEDELADMFASAAMT